jgi:nitrite reductase (NADH) small subunit
MRYAACKVGDLVENDSTTLEAGNKRIAVFFTQGNYYAIDDFCPHAGAPLAGGHVEDCIVTCSWHGWRFRLTDGTWADNPRLKIGSYPCTIEGDTVYVEVPDTPQWPKS